MDHIIIIACCCCCCRLIFIVKKNLINNQTKREKEMKMRFFALLVGINFIWKNPKQTNWVCSYRSFFFLQLPSPRHVTPSPKLFWNNLNKTKQKVPAKKKHAHVCSFPSDVITQKLIMSVCMWWYCRGHTSTGTVLVACFFFFAGSFISICWIIFRLLLLFAVYFHFFFFFCFSMLRTYKYNIIITTCFCCCCCCSSCCCRWWNMIIK